MAVSSDLERKAYEIFRKQKQRAGVEYSRLEFTAWFVKERTKKKWNRPHVARFDHDKPYSFENIEMQEQLENNRERNARCGNPGKTHRPVKSIELRTKEEKIFASKIEAARHFGVNEKTVYNHCSGKTTRFWAFGPQNAKVRFEWA